MDSERRKSIDTPGNTADVPLQCRGFFHVADLHFEISSSPRNLSTVKSSSAAWRMSTRGSFAQDDSLAQVIVHAAGTEGTQQGG